MAFHLKDDLPIIANLMLIGSIPILAYSILKDTTIFSFFYLLSGLSIILSAILFFEFLRIFPKALRELKEPNRLAWWAFFLLKIGMGFLFVGAIVSLIKMLIPTIL